MAPQDLPPELWLRIASFLRRDEVMRLVGVNLTLFNLALDAQYAVVHIDGLTTPATVRMLERLRDPIPASRVRSLVFHPGLKPKKTTNPALRPPASPPSGRSSFKFWNRNKAAVPPSPPPPPQPSFEQLVDALTRVFPGLVNLRSFEMEAWDLEAAYDGFLRTAWSAFGPRLEALSFGGTPQNFRQLVESKPNIPACTSLSLQFSQAVDAATKPASATAAADDVLTNTLAPYINSLAPQLQVFKVWSWSTLDLSPLFLNLGTFPHLHDIHVRSPFNTFTNPVGLTSVLENNAETLTSVELRLNPMGSAVDNTVEQPLATWLLSHKEHNPQVMTGLKTLRIFPTNLDDGFATLLVYLERSVKTLRTLAVKDRYMSLDEISTLLAPLAYSAGEDGLESLRLHVRAWSPELFALLATQLPGLRSLSLYLGGSPPDRAAAQLFFDKLRAARESRSWALQDIGVWQGGFEVSLTTMHSLAECIPTVRSFWGNGEMVSDTKLYESGLSFERFAS
ncbi:hypothetical protein HMN09_00412000 [Mycena chlorophos]|uniref:F-box domain-containing protein n=1 Tax=Mycena chlorophos TaxID=658473 RepID=A0A8H6TGF3_MYCCL|nr:hypothetical protein HMN09_00412000 [Mycena chlorophos]